MINLILLKQLANEIRPTLFLQGDTVLDRSPNRFVPVNSSDGTLPVSSEDGLFGQGSLLYGPGKFINYDGQKIPVPTTDEFTFELFIKVNRFPPAANRWDHPQVFVAGKMGSNSNALFFLYFEEGMPMFAMSGMFSPLSYASFTTYIMPDKAWLRLDRDTWYHIAVTRTNKDGKSQFHMYINGERQGGSRYNHIPTIHNWLNNFYIGTPVSMLDYHPFEGNIYNLRYTIGKCLYEENFSIPNSPF